nr:structural protein [Sobelivirales sp.]WRQ65712.1 structural protein [Tolivirales sp.]
MNSPVSCLPDPIQNMVKKKSKTQKRPRATLSRVPRFRGIMAPAAMGGVVSKNQSNLPITAGIGRMMTVQNYELSRTFPTQAGTPAFNNQGLTVNPGISSAFPWLSAIALNYSKFRFRFLRYMYVPQVPTTVAGVCYINISYDSADSTPSTLAQVSQSDSSTIGPVWHGGGINADKAFSKNLGVDEMIYCDVDCTKWTQPYYYVRSQGNTDADTKPAVVNYGIDSSVPAAITPGQLYVAYIVDLFEPVASALNA